MYELCKVGESTYYVESPAKVGIYVYPDNTAVLIDSGNDKDAAKKVYKILNEHNWTLCAILNSHSHSDHIGGNAFLQGKTGCRIFASGIDAAVSCHTLLEPTVLYGGCPAKDLKHKFLMASPSRVEDISSPDFPKEIEVIPLPGHSFDLVAYKTPDGVVFISDTISSRVTLEKYGIPYIFDIG
ncbi:MAG: MBL fold metallo-hydrolase, partial [Oscillospiraceae bacterium]|nr:MBL fold metallo-hydrolase [Oscillospiraceae bacterium]